MGSFAFTMLRIVEQRTELQHLLVAELCHKLDAGSSKSNQSRHIETTEFRFYCFCTIYILITMEF